VNLLSTGIYRIGALALDNVLGTKDIFSQMLSCPYLEMPICNIPNWQKQYKLRFWGMFSSPNFWGSYSEEALKRL